MGERFGPALALGLFCGRILGERLVAGSPLAPEGLRPAGALILTILTISAAALWLRRFDLSQLWPLLLLLIYVLYPEPAPTVALSAALLVTFTILQTMFRRWPQPGERRFPAAAPILFLTVSFAYLYGVTMARDVLPADNGELQLISSNLGVAHPPGFPLYTLLGHVFTRLPLGETPAFRVNMLSLITSVLALHFTYLSLLRVTRRPLISVMATVALGTSTTFWAQATIANIRSMTGLFAAAAFYLLLRFRDAVEAQEKQNEGSKERSITYATRANGDRSLILFALIMGFGISHHASLIFMAIIFVIFLLVTDSSLVRMPRRWLRPLLVCALGLLPLLYLPWRGLVQANGVEVRGASPALATLDGFLNHVLALGFRGDLFHFLEPSVLVERMKVMANVMTFQFSPVLLCGMGLGLAMMLWRERRLALLLAGSYAIHTFVTATYRAPQSVEYMLPAYIPAVITLGYGVARIDGSIRANRRRLSAALGSMLVALMAVSTISQATRAYASFRLQQDGSPAREYATSLIAEAPHAAVILADWHWATPLWYLQEVEGQRTDIDIQYVFPTDEPYAITWSRRIREELSSGRDVVATHFDEQAYDGLPPAEPIGDAFLYRQGPLLSMPADFTPVDLILGPTIKIEGLSIDGERIEIGQGAILTIAWQMVADLQPTATLFAHLVGDDGIIYAQDDLPALPQHDGITLTQFRLTPRFGTIPGEHGVMIGAYGETPLLNPDGQARTPVASLTVVPMSHPAVTDHPLYRPVSDEGSNRRLVGYDWDDTFPESRRLYLHWWAADGYFVEVREGKEAESPILPHYLGPWGVSSDRWSLGGRTNSHYVPFGQGIVWTGPLLDEEKTVRPGETIRLRQTFQASRPVTDDLATSVRLVGYESDGIHWAWWDLDDEFGIPAMGAIPTLKWIADSTIHDPHRLTVDDNAYPGQTIGVVLGLHETFTGRRLPILDARFSQATPWRLTSVAP